MLQVDSSRHVIMLQVDCSSRHVVLLQVDSSSRHVIMLQVDSSSRHRLLCCRWTVLLDTCYYAAGGLHF